ncbi:MAG: Hsp33 family molecular chaperone HslO [Myxococcaceae bacterium]|nr:Hsp33 family molecular chaperone HslO [Myxococcaceae bacterium]
MVDEVVMGVLPEDELRVVLVSATGVARTARDKHRARPAAAHVLAESLTAASLLAALQLQKSSARINLQLECDGPLRGVFVESDSVGAVRGYVKNPLVEYEGHQGAYHWRPVYGNAGFLSVLRDEGSGEFFRSSVELESFDLARDFEHYFSASEQLPTGVAIEVVPEGEEPLGRVVGVLLQALPGGNVEALRQRTEALRGGRLREAIIAAGPELPPAQLLTRLFEGEKLEITSRYPLEWKCPCSKERVIRALLTLGRDELLDMLARDKKAEATCQFCSSTYVVSDAELAGLIDRLN